MLEEGFMMSTKAEERNLCRLWSRRDFIRNCMTKVGTWFYHVQIGKEK